MIGRLDAPGAKLEPVMPGFENRRSPSVAALLAADFLVWDDGDGRELIGHDRQHALLGRGCGRCGCGSAGRSRLRPGAARATRAGVRDGTVRCRTIGLGAVTVISGSFVSPAGRPRPRPSRCCPSRIVVARLLH